MKVTVIFLEEVALLCYQVCVNGVEQMCWRGVLLLIWPRSQAAGERA